MAGLVKYFYGHVLNKSKENVDLEDEKYQDKVIGLYFSAHWCPPCRRFTPVLIEFYKKHAENKQFEVIFISSDNDEESFEEYYKDMPWLALDYNEREKKEELSGKLGVDGIPALVLFDGNSGDIICKNARDHIQHGDTDGKNFPWKLTDKKQCGKCTLM